MQATHSFVQHELVHQLHGFLLKVVLKEQLDAHGKLAPATSGQLKWRPVHVHNVVGSVGMMQVKAHLKISVLSLLSL